MRIWRLCFLCWLLVGFCQNGQAQREEDFEWQDPLDTPIGDIGDKWNIIYNIIAASATQFIPHDTLKLKGLRKNWYVSTYADFQREYKNRPPQSDAIALRFRIEQYLKPWLSLGADIGPMFMTDEVEQHIGLGSMLVFNWHIIKSKHHAFNFENSFGTILFNDIFPDGGTAFNFNYYYGFIYQMRINERTQLDLGFRNQHISNGDLFNSENPGYDGYGFRIGFSRSFDKSQYKVLPWRESFLNPF